MEKTKKTDFYDPKNLEFRKLANKIIENTSKIKESKNSKKEEPKSNFYRLDGNFDYFDNYADLREFGRDIQSGLISLDEA